MVQRLPKTRSGKILRGTMKRIADGVEYRMPATIDDPIILDEITEALGDSRVSTSKCTVEVDTLYAKKPLLTYQKQAYML